MKCLKKGCNGKLHVTHSYTTSGGRFQRAYCEVCRAPYCLQTVAEPVVRRGDGARAKAKRANKQPA